MAPIFGKPLVAEDIAGAGTTIAAGAFRRAAPDGHTILIGTNNHALRAEIGRWTPIVTRLNLTP